MNYFLDTEFHQDGTYVELISIGVVAADGREYYAQNSDCPLEKSNEFVKQYVLPLLDETSWKPASIIGDELANFILKPDKDYPQIWVYYGNYDWVSVCGTLYGDMTKTPKGFPYTPFDLSQWAHQLGYSKILVDKPAEHIAHNALVDARWNREAYLWLQDIERSQKRLRPPS